MTIDVSARAERLHQERVWLRRRTQGDELFEKLGCTHATYAYEGRRFVAWTVVDGKPRIEALFRADAIKLTAGGLAVTFDVQRPGHGLGRFTATAQPEKVPGLDLFLWMPAFGDIHYVPFKWSDEHSPWRVSVSFVAKTGNRPDVGAVEGGRYFATAKEFASYWPEHAIA
jgi:hypothetical protein